jgi:hypothetical protein
VLQLPAARLRAQQHHAHQLRTQLLAAVVDIKAAAVANRTAAVAAVGLMVAADIKAAVGNNL